MKLLFRFSSSCRAMALGVLAVCAQPPAAGKPWPNLAAAAPQAVTVVGLPDARGAPGATGAPDSTLLAQARAKPQPLSQAEIAASAAMGAAPVNAKKDVRTEMTPDRTCSRPQEKFNVWEKVVEYGGAEASLRLERLISSDYKYDDVSPQDRDMLRYLAQTTIWVPVELENTLARTFDRFSGKKIELSDLNESALKRMDAQLEVLQQEVKDFPGNARLSLNPDVADGAYAKFGGLIQLSTRFLELMDQHPAARDLVLAHELSHVYKRHSVKQLQFQMLSSRDGFELTKKVLSRARLGTNINPIQDAFFVVTVVPQIVGFVRGMQSGFSREQELEADACAVEWMHRAKIDTCAAWSGFKVIAPKEGVAKSPYFDSHPPSKEREENYVKRIAGLPCASMPQKAAPGKPGAIKPPVPAAAPPKK